MFLSRSSLLDENMHPQLKRLVATLLEFVLASTTIAAHAQSDKAGDDLDQKLSYAYVLTMDKINKLAEVRKALGEYLENNEQASKRMDDDKSLVKGTIAERANAFDTKHPEVAAIIRKKGISTLEYLLANQVLLKAFMLVGAKKHGEIQDYSKAGAGVNPANLTFVEQHWEEIRKSMQDIRFRM
jgi:hypothetical protein